MVKMQRLAAEVGDLDLVVGGHSHTFLYTPSEEYPLPSIEQPQGEYFALVVFLLQPYSFSFFYSSFYSYSY